MFDIQIFQMDDTESRSGCLMLFKLATAGMGIVFGLTTFLVFTFVYGNIHAGSWALLSGVFATFVFHLHLLYKNHRYNNSIGWFILNKVINVYYCKLLKNPLL